MKCYIDINQIKYMATNTESFNKGMDIFKNDGVTGITINETNENAQIIAKVSGGASDNKIYTTSITFDSEGILRRHHCTCNSHGMWRGACIHVIALGFKLFNSNKEILLQSRFKRLSSSMLDVFEKLAYDEIDSVINSYSSTESQVSIVPTLNIDKNNNPYLTFSIGRNKKYLIKNISDFLRNLSYGETVEYGKSFIFNHKLSYLDTQSQNLVRLIKSEHKYYNRHEKSINFSSNVASNKSLSLSKRGVDDFFELYIDNYVNINLNDLTSREFYFATSKPNIVFDVKINEDKIELNDNNGKIKGIVGGKYSYLFHNNIFYRVNKEYYKTVYNIIELFYTAEMKTLIFDVEESKKFLNFVYPRLKNNDLLVEELDFTDIEIPYNELKTKVYLDSHEDTISFKLLFCYGDLEINPVISEKINMEDRNALEEYKFIQQIISYGFTVDIEKGLYTLTGDDLVYDFYYSLNGLSKLTQQAEVYSTDSFKNKSVKPKLSTSFGVRLSGNILELDIDSSEYNLKELFEILQSYKLKKKFHKLKNGSFLSLEDDNNNFNSSLEFISNLGVSSKDITNGKINIPKYRALYLENLITKNKDIIIQQDSDISKIADDFNNFKSLDFSPPDHLTNILRDYQKEGFNWLKIISYYGFGGILADDMGLGKTLQVIAVLASEKGISTSPSIVIAPTSLIYNWENEIIRFAPELNTLTVAGPASKRLEILTNEEKPDIYITTFDMLKRDIEFYEDIIFRYIIVDEAQNIKNPSTQNSQAVKSLKGEVRYALTGTPIENSLSELWSIFDFVMPGYLFNHSKFVKLYESPIIKEDDSNASESLRSMISPFILRRLKKDVLLELPDKIESTLYADMTDEQRKIYTAYLLQAKGRTRRNNKTW